jgi:hypothetical protein
MRYLNCSSNAACCIGDSFKLNSVFKKQDFCQIVLIIILVANSYHKGPNKIATRMP